MQRLQGHRFVHLRSLYLHWYNVRGKGRHDRWAADHADPSPLPRTTCRLGHASRRRVRVRYQRRNITSCSRKPVSRNVANKVRSASEHAAKKRASSPWRYIFTSGVMRSGSDSSFVIPLLPWRLRNCATNSFIFAMSVGLFQRLDLLQVFSDGDVQRRLLDSLAGCFKSGDTQFAAFQFMVLAPLYLKCLGGDASAHTTASAAHVPLDIVAAVGDGVPVVVAFGIPREPALSCL